ncbi:TVP38/TMEM64 family protein [Sporobolomyces salmoneus]|uniref:TVP38/TMEM64 family protein n=1 Tax=Sporobolomyces salmoneus TaxID=183962 RepID=UPI00317CF133
MPPSRARSSTVTSNSSTTSRSSTPRIGIAKNPSQLLGTPESTSSSTLELYPDYNNNWDKGSNQQVARSYRSEHSMRTIRPGKDDLEDDDEEEGDKEETEDRGQKRRNTQFVIDLDTSGGGGGDSESSSSTTLVGNRPRSSTFGGVELPPAPSLVLERDDSEPAHELSNDSRLETGDSVLPRPSLASRGRSTSVSSLTSLRSLDPSLHLGGAPLKERRPVLYAGLQAGALLLISLLALYLLLKGLLPPIDDEHRDKVKLPKSFDDLKALNEVLQVYKDRNYWRVLGCYCTVYLFLQAFSVPGSMYLSILGGALYGVLVALPLVCTCVATGALLCYFISAALGPAVLLHSEVWRKRVDAWSERVRSHQENLISYLIVIRIAPLPPHWMVNVVAPHLGISMWHFWISTFLGIAGVTYIHTQIGTTLDQMTSTSDFHLISWQNGLGLGGIVLAVLIPVLLRKYYSKDLSEAASDPAGPDAPRHSYDPILSARNSLALDDDARRSFSSTDGSARLPGQRFHDDSTVEGDEGDGIGTGRPKLKEGAGNAKKVSRLLGVQVA